MKKYQPQEFGKKWIEQWDKEKTYKTGSQFTDHSSQKMYVLDMFPYPSGAGLHVGHPRGYTATDILARYYRMNNKAVLHPMGWDAFGLPAENAAIKAKKNPQDMVPINIANFKRQMKMLGLSYDWEREFDTTDPSYYKWTQWLFIQFFKLGLLYKKNIPVYYCEFCKTGLAEEEVLPNGLHERCNNLITRKELPQWIFRITTYADRLLSDLDGLDWPQGILEMQRNWIGRKEGITIFYKVKDIEDVIACFTTRPDTNFGATFIVLAPEHEFVKKTMSGKNTIPGYSKKVAEYVKKAIAKTDLERLAEGKKKTGVFTGYYAINNLNGNSLPIWVSDFVLSDFGTGAVVGVPGHDIRDFEFAQEFGIEVVRVVIGPDDDASTITRKEQVQEEAGTMVQSEFLDGLDIQSAKKKIMNYLEEKGWGRRVVSYHLRDWIFSRQRYWGEPTPMVFCKHCAEKKISWWDTVAGKEFQKANQKISKLNKDVQEASFGWFPLDEKSLPLKLPYVQSYEPSVTGESPLATMHEWVAAQCPNCGKPARRETDTMPNWAGSCWYFLRFADPHNASQPWSKEAMKQWEPVDWYFGGAEHAVLHLLYSRFWIKALYDLKLINFKEPFLRLRNVGMILAGDHHKMSKSLGNVINPDEVVSEFGADALRVYEMFMAPFSQEIAWSTASLQGSHRFLRRVWNLVHSSQFTVHGDMTEDKKLVHKLNKTIQKVSTDITDVKYNTAVAAMMEFVNAWDEAGKYLTHEQVKRFLQILAPFAPFTAEELWRGVLGEKTSIHLSRWPVVNKLLLVEKEVSIPVQVNGRVRGVVTTSHNDIEEKSIVKHALSNQHIKKYVSGKKYTVVYIKGRILNFVLQ